MTRIGQILSLVFAAVLLLMGDAGATTRFHLRVRGVWQIPQRFVFSLTCSDSLNRVTILNAEHDGVWGSITSVGWPLIGDLLGGHNPADTTIIVGGTFYAEIGATIQGFTLFDCDLDLSEEAPASGAATSQFALYWRDSQDQVRVATDDPYGTDALCAIDITGAPGGELSVFYPLAFVAPDTLLLAGDVVATPAPRSADRLRFSSIVPNPARKGARFAFDLPQRGEVRLRVYDVVGRLVAQPLHETRAAGPVALDWDLRVRSGGFAPAGVYIAELRFGRQTAVRRFVVTR
jgi:hypothetical protein